MSRGPGRIMRSALAELDDTGHADPWTVLAHMAHMAHNEECGCPDRCTYGNVGYRQIREAAQQAKLCHGQDRS